MAQYHDAIIAQRLCNARHRISNAIAFAMLAIARRFWAQKPV